MGIVVLVEANKFVNFGAEFEEKKTTCVAQVVQITSWRIVELYELS